MGVILHSDLNSFYASVELLHRPAFRDRPLVVGGGEAARHGIVLAKNDLAKKRGIQTGMALWEARQLCKSLVTVPPNMALYLQFSRLARRVYEDYTDRIEPFGIDEAWLEIGASHTTVEEGKHIADEIRRRMRHELGMTVSIGVSYNKIFAKLGSDMKKPDGTTVISRENYRQVAWPLPVEDLLYVGPATKRKLSLRQIHTIGDLARQDPHYLRRILHKPGALLWAFANGYDRSPVFPAGEAQVIQSIGNSITTPRDLTNNLDVKMVFTFLAESVAARLREGGFTCSTVVIYVRDNALASFERQAPLYRPTTLVSDLVTAAMALFERQYRWGKPIRSIGIRGSGLAPASQMIQLSVFPEEEKRRKLERLDQTVDGIRSRFGYRCIRRGVTLLDNALTAVDVKQEHVVYPVSYRHEGGLNHAQP